MSGYEPGDVATVEPPIGSVVVDRDGMRWERRDDGCWYFNGGRINWNPALFGPYRFGRWGYER